MNVFLAMVWLSNSLVNSDSLVNFDSLLFGVLILICRQERSLPDTVLLHNTHIKYVLYIMTLHSHGAAIAMQCHLAMMTPAYFLFCFLFFARL